MASFGRPETTFQQVIHRERIARNRMRPVIFLLLVYLLILVLIGGVGIGIGFVLHWLIPDIAIDMGTLIGVVTVGWAGLVYARMMDAVVEIHEEEELESARREIETVILKPVPRPRSIKRKKK